ncbi:DUF418 domain-containing protein [Parvularcula sp. IMCC14364]|uniref:DUF418 domain-containing protein n=1 Tax=Parvularcula sp. IMCC14364 TaxID=3067902 RepID=UPI00274113C1|nr:DUF418 domain-containing protein [Parvularcula sp. IMCC14364]
MSTADAPVSLENRLDYMDVLRGFAVMAIFIVNIKAMFQPFAFYANPLLWGSDVDAFIANVQNIFVDNKWRTNFTALFGAGLMLIAMKAEEAGGDRKEAGRRLRRRLTFLLLFGLVHLVGIWMGDILTVYAITGFIAILFRNMSTGKLIFWTIFFMILGSLWMGGFMMATPYIPGMAEKMSGMMWGTDPEMLAKESAIYLGGIPGHIAYRAENALGMIIGYGLFGGMFAMTLGLMLAGMVLFKTGFLQGRWKSSVYLPIAIIALGSAWGMEFWRVLELNKANWSYEAFSVWTPVIMIAGPLGAFGYAALIAFILRVGPKLSPVAAVGRMAFTNYIACSVLGTTLAYGHGLGLYGEVSLQQLMLIVGATFVAMLVWSPLWLSVFRFGPLEWLWRSLTYKKIQPFMK